jgi:hypothetical protein
LTADDFDPLERGSRGRADVQTFTDAFDLLATTFRLYGSAADRAGPHGVLPGASAPDQR